MALAFATDGAAVEAGVSDDERLGDGPAPIGTPRNLTAEEHPEDGIFILPGGYVDADNVAHHRVEVVPVTGKEEEFLATVQATAGVASVVTGLLSRFIKRIGSLGQVSAAAVRDLLVGDRDYLILKLREMTFGKQVEAVLSCPRADCGKPMDLILSLDDLPIERRPVTTRRFQMALADGPRGERLVEFRLPTGADQEALAAEYHADESQATYKLLARCIERIDDAEPVDEAMVLSLGEPALTSIEAEIERLAPPSSMAMELVCPECQSPFNTALDFTAFFLTEMRANLRQLERDVHFLAWHYHWSEQDILAMTRIKRRRYVRRLQEEIDRFN
ncbi:MAG TPA: hypothetical protein VJ464_12000 [Blastocatellia bacterium]|nr:hypothetical protein [Blastocatellia bacterium]